MDLFELKECEYTSATVKNQLITKSTDDYIAFVNLKYSDSSQILNFINENNLLYQNEVIVFGDYIPDGICNQIDILNSFSMEVYSIIMKRSLFVITGCYNEQLYYNTDFELLCRLSGHTDIFCIACTDERDYTITNDASALTYAYIIKKYIHTLKRSDTLYSYLERITHFLMQSNYIDNFKEYMSRMLYDDKYYAQIDQNTAPVLILSGDNTCYGVIKDFAYYLAEALISLGQAVITTDGKYGIIENIKNLKNIQIKCIIGFQATSLVNEFFRNINTTKFIFLFDNPIFFSNCLRNLSDDYYILCQDGDYAKFMSTHLNIKNALHFPPAGRGLGLAYNQDRIYDIVFIGTYYPVATKLLTNDSCKKYFNHLIMNPSDNFEVSLNRFNNLHKIINEDEDLISLLFELKPIHQNAINHYRHLVIETIISSGINLHVFGDSWNNFESEYKSNLIIHPNINVDESLIVYSKAKIGLNIMSWHKAGMTERIANIMLSGAVCLSDETTYLREHFIEDEEIILFSLEALNHLTDKIHILLADIEYRTNIARKAYRKANKEHVWNTKARQILDILSC